jgi:putative peptidoglycan lipid II flippase
MATTREPEVGAPPDDEGDDRSGRPTGAQRRIAGATGIMMAGILGSRLLGLVRERVIAHQFGQGRYTDVYNGAFTIPDLLFFLIAGGALSGAFIPVFSEYIAKGQEKDAWRIFSVVATVMTVVVAGFIVLGEIFATPLVIKTNPGFVAIPGKVADTVWLTRILLPAQICFFLGGLMMATLQVRHRFGPVVLGPIIYNLGIILGGIFLVKNAPVHGVAGLCYGAVIGAVVGNLGLQWYMVRKTGGYFVTQGLRRHFGHPGVKKVWKLMLPVILGLALPQVSTIIGKMFASRLGDGPPSALMNANKLMQVPLGVFAQATAQAIFPTMSAQAARNDIKALRKSVNFGIRSILFLTVPSSLLMFVLALPIVQLLLQSGQFNTEAAEMAAAALRYFAVGIFAWSAHSILTRGFYALQDSRTPVIVGTVVTAIFIPLNGLVLYYTGTGPAHQTLATAGLALVTSVAATIHMLLMLVLLRKRLRGLEGGRLLSSAVRILTASVLTTCVCRVIRDAMQSRLIPAPPIVDTQVTRHSAEILGVCLLVSVLVYAALAFLFRMEEIDLLRRLLRRKAKDTLSTD